LIWIKFTGQAVLLIQKLCQYEETMGALNDYQALEKLCPIAESHHCTLAQLAIAWLISQPQTNIVGANYSEQVTNVKLSTQDLQQIDAICMIALSSAYRTYCHRPFR
jgi:aryl-alcohol dehydrogenase-like predicted oxidoreductase